jgi:tetratricopeptide (TPR) repeat protein
MFSKVFQVTYMTCLLAFSTYAEEESSYTERDAYLRQLTSKNSEQLPSYAKAWYLRGVNDFEEGLLLEKSQKKEESLKLFDRSAAALETAESLLIKENPSLAAEAILLKAKAYSHSEKNKVLTIKSLEKLWSEQPPLVNLLPEPLDAAIFYSNLPETKPDEAITKLTSGIQAFPQSNLKPQALLLLGTLYYQKGEYSEAEKAFHEIVLNNPHSALAPHALLWMAYSCEKSKKDKEAVSFLRKQLLDQYPDAPEAPEAYFTLYS